MKPLLFSIILALTACVTPPRRLLIKTQASGNYTGATFYKTVAASNWKERDSIAVASITNGNIPDFLKRFVRISTTIITADGKKIKATYYVMPDYLSVGNNADWARVPLTPMAAQVIADTFNCFLPTRKMVNDIYKASVVKLPPQPMFAYRDSSVTMYQHHLIIEGLRKGKNGLIAGIKKDVVLTGKIKRDAKPNRVAIYGWHTLDGKPIQPLYTGHVNWYVDYSHGIRLVYNTIWINGKPMNYKAVLQREELRKLLCDEEFCDMYSY
jgi:hypothetical protein